jgi:hypothetical protein
MSNLQSVPGKSVSGIERRRFERVGIPRAARMKVYDWCDAPIGWVCQLSRGGMLLEIPDEPFAAGEEHTFTLREVSEEISICVSAVVRHVHSTLVGCEFQSMDAETAVRIGVLMGKYYSGSDRAAES